MIRPRFAFTELQQAHILETHLALLDDKLLYGRTIEIIEQENLVSRTRDHTAPLFGDKLASLADHPIVGEVRTRGLLGAIELVPAKPSRHSSVRPS